MPTIPNPGLTGVPPAKLAYNPADLGDAAKASAEVRALFDFIGAYTPLAVELAAPLRCFVPDFIPAIGGVDEGLRVRGAILWLQFRRQRGRFYVSPAAGGRQP